MVKRNREGMHIEKSALCGLFLHPEFSHTPTSNAGDRTTIARPQSPCHIADQLIQGNIPEFPRKYRHLPLGKKVSKCVVRPAQEVRVASVSTEQSIPSPVAGTPGRGEVYP